MMKRLHYSVIPDAYFRLLHNDITYHHFVEVDRGTETERVLRAKIENYRDYMKPSDGALSVYEQQYGTNKGRVLFVTSGPKRTANLKAITESCGGKGRFWFTTLKDLQTADPLTDPIWYKAGSPDPLSFLW